MPSRMPQSNAAELLEQLNAINSNPEAQADIPADLRLHLSLAAQELCHKLETPADTVARIMLIQPAENAYVRIAADLKLYTALADGSKPKTLEQLAEATKADSALLARVLRGLVSVHAVYETSDDRYSLAPSHSLLVNPRLASSYSPCADFMDKVYNSLPPFLSKTKYQNPTNPLNTATTLAFNKPNQPFYEIVAQYPETMNAFATLMDVWADGFNTIDTLYPVQDKLINGFSSTVSEVMFVDVGGGMGQKAVQFKLAHPDAPGRVVVQDQEPIIAGAPVAEDRYKGVELTVHDFMTEQPIKGARCYYLRQTLHNWADEEVIVILKHLRDAAEPGYSRILIHDIIMSKRGNKQWPVMQDFDMMTMFAALERTEDQWRVLCGKAGLKVVGVYTDEHPASEGIIEAEV